jgi:hypothetical protein
MRLVANLSADQIEAGIEYFNISNDLHAEGLRTLREFEQLSDKQVLSMINSKEPLIRKYGAIIAKCKLQSDPDLMMKVAKSPDSDLQEFSHSFVS